jgi:hypothetical protein
MTDGGGSVKLPPGPPRLGSPAARGMKATRSWRDGCVLTLGVGARLEFASAMNRNSRLSVSEAEAGAEPAAATVTEAGPATETTTLGTARLVGGWPPSQAKSQA